ADVAQSLDVPARERRSQVLDGLARLGEHQHLLGRAQLREEVLERLQLRVLRQSERALRQLLLPRRRETRSERRRRAAHPPQQRGEHGARRELRVRQGEADIMLQLALFIRLVDGDQCEAQWTVTSYDRPPTEY